MANRILIATLAGLSGFLTVLPANAQGQQIRVDARQKATFYNAPRQIQIIDERPIIHDFREAPQAPQYLSLPPGPQAYGAAGSPGGAPGGQPQMTTGNVINLNALPKSGFGQFSNIPARGLGPQTALPSGSQTGVHSALPVAGRPAPRPQAGTPAPIVRPGVTPRPSGPATVASYGSNYTQGASSGVRTGGSVNTAVSGRLMNRLKQ